MGSESSKSTKVEGNNANANDISAIQEVIQGNGSDIKIMIIIIAILQEILVIHQLYKLTVVAAMCRSRKNRRDIL